MIEAWLEAVRDTLRTALVSSMPGGAPKAKHYVAIQSDDGWPAKMGEWFVGVDEYGSEASPSDRDFLKENFAVSVTITKRTGVFAKDWTEDIYLQSLRGLKPLTRLIIPAIHAKQDVRAAANTAGGLPHVDNGDQFIAPLYYAGSTKATTTADIYADAENPPTLIRRKLIFRGGVRIQALDVMH